MTDLAVLLRLSVIEHEMHDLARHLPDRRGEVVRHAARVLKLAGSTEANHDPPANDNGGRDR